jgi:elongation factor Ts
MVDIELLKKLRNETLVSLADCRKALEETRNDYRKALDILKKSGLEKAAKKAERETLQGMIGSYIHQNGRVGVLVEVLCETDFVALTDEFKNLVHEVGMQIAAMNPKDVPALLKQEYIRDPKETMELVIKGVIAKLGENIVVKRFQRFEIGE